MHISKSALLLLRLQDISGRVCCWVLDFGAALHWSFCRLHYTRATHPFQVCWQPTSFI